MTEDQTSKLSAEDQTSKLSTEDQTSKLSEDPAPDSEDAEEAYEELAIEAGWWATYARPVQERVLGACVRAKDRLHSVATAAFERAVDACWSIWPGWEDDEADADDELEAADLEPAGRWSRSGGRVRAGEEDDDLDDDDLEDDEESGLLRGLENVLILLCIALATGVGGIAFAYDMFKAQLGHDAARIAHQDQALARLSVTGVKEKKKIDALKAQLAHAQRGASRQSGSEADGTGTGAQGGHGAWHHAGSCTIVNADVRAKLDGCIADMSRR